MFDRIADVPQRFPVVVGVDGSRSNQAAVRYAVEEATAIRRPLLLVAVLDDMGDPSGLQQSLPDWTFLSAIGRRATSQHPDLRVSSTLEFGDPSARLLERARRADRLVIGQRGLGTFDQPILGSTSTTVAARSHRPVVTVPTDWRLEDHRRHAVVVGIDPTDPDVSALCFAFEEAARREATLVAVHAFDSEPRLLWDPVLAGPTHRGTFTLGARSLSDVVAPFSSVFPSVPITLRDERSDPATALLRNSRAAQLLVLGRGERGPFGPGLGSTSRAVLQYAEIPVAVIPG